MTREGVTWDEVTYGEPISELVCNLLILVGVLVGFLHACFSLEQKAVPSPIKVESFFDVKYLHTSVSRLDDGDLPLVKVTEVPKELPLEATKCDVIERHDPRIDCKWIDDGTLYEGIVVVPGLSSDVYWRYDEVSHIFEPDPYAEVKVMGGVFLLFALLYSVPLYFMFKFFYLKLVEVIRR